MTGINDAARVAVRPVVRNERPPEADNGRYANLGRPDTS
jgi:hypothetical protein